MLMCVRVSSVVAVAHRNYALADTGMLWVWGRASVPAQTSSRSAMASSALV